MKVLFSPRHALHAPKRVTRLGGFSAGRDVPERAGCPMHDRLAPIGLPTALVQEGGSAIGTLGRCLAGFFAGFEAAA